MKVPDFLMYLAVMNGDAGAEPRPFVVMDADENEETIEPCDFKKNVFYMTDIDKKHFHEINKAFMRTFKVRKEAALPPVSPICIAC